MSDYDDTNRGVLFKNDKKVTDKHPNMSGTININGTDYWLNGWSKISQAGNKFISLSIGKPKEVQKSTEEAAPTGEDGDIW